MKEEDRAPDGSAVPSKASAAEVLLTVAWELSWYQWEVGADGEGADGGPVREVAKGAELSELDEKARTWNAAVDEDGTLRLRSATEQPEQAAQEA